MSQGQPKILFPTDFSHTGEMPRWNWQLRWPASIGQTLVIVHVEEPRPAYGGARSIRYAGAERQPKICRRCSPKSVRRLGPSRTSII